MVVDWLANRIEHVVLSPEATEGSRTTAFDVLEGVGTLNRICHATEYGLQQKTLMWESCWV